MATETPSTEGTDVVVAPSTELAEVSDARKVLALQKTQDIRTNLRIGQAALEQCQADLAFVNRERLYLALDFSSFEKYAKASFGISRATAYRHVEMAAARSVGDAALAAVPKNVAEALGKSTTARLISEGATPEQMAEAAERRNGERDKRAAKAEAAKAQALASTAETDDAAEARTRAQAPYVVAFVRIVEAAELDDTPRHLLAANIATTPTTRQEIAAVQAFLAEIEAGVERAEAAATEAAAEVTATDAARKAARTGGKAAA